MEQIVCRPGVGNLIYLTDKEIRGTRINFVDATAREAVCNPSERPVSFDCGEGGADRDSECPPFGPRPELSHLLRPLGVKAVTSDGDEHRTRRSRKQGSARPVRERRAGAGQDRAPRGTWQGG